jgi:TonB-dependent SusC/RagA subfamily outer membrane receptor
LDEVVAVGYGTMKKRDLTGSVVSISGDDLRKLPAASVDKALQGLSPGVTAISNSGQPGSDMVIRIRGIGTTNDSSPLFVVDGVQVNNINFLSPGDIKSVEILKDASACAIYGARGANGVIIVSTKQGDKSGKMKLNAEVYYGVQNRAKKLSLMNSEQLSNFGVTPVILQKNLTSGFMIILLDQKVIYLQELIFHRMIPIGKTLSLKEMLQFRIIIFRPMEVRINFLIC